MRGGSSKLQLPVSQDRQGKQLIFYGVRVTSVFWMCFLFSHPIMPAKCPSVSPASGKRKTISLEMKLKIIAELQANVSVLRRYEVG